jgi:hypothetical protein
MADDIHLFKGPLTIAAIQLFDSEGKALPAVEFVRPIKVADGETFELELHIQMKHERSERREVRRKSGGES